MKLLTERIPQVTRLMCIAIAFWVAAGFTAFADVKGTIQDLTLKHISEPTRHAAIAYGVFSVK
ncbi:MAG: hypothetical protein K2F62_03695, partial [Muribaculaceae bacterium]|nr:hypothetical protein [Muribaculaceae bacterium]